MDFLIVDPSLIPRPPEVAAREDFKTQRTAAVAAIVVKTAAGHEFDGDEDSQNRLTRAILGMQLAGLTVFPDTWTLADNTPLENPTLDELAEALLLAGQAQAALWAIPA